MGSALNPDQLKKEIKISPKIKKHNKEEEQVLKDSVRKLINIMCGSFGLCLIFMLIASVIGTQNTSQHGELSPSISAVISVLSGLIGITLLWFLPLYAAWQYKTRNRWLALVMWFFIIAFGIGWLVCAYMTYSEIKEGQYQGGDNDSENIKNSKDISDRTECPFCAELVKPKALVCRYCGSTLKKEKRKMSEQEIEDLFKQSEE